MASSFDGCSNKQTNKKKKKKKKSKRFERENGKKRRGKAGARPHLRHARPSRGLSSYCDRHRFLCKALTRVATALGNERALSLPLELEHEHSKIDKSPRCSYSGGDPRTISANDRSADRWILFGRCRTSSFNFYIESFF